jgi:L-ascorbate metabolism protein UlaG (beta-lactamase superfamily)
MLVRGAAALALLLTGPAAAGQAPSTQLRATWMGGATLVFRFGPITLVTDPVLGEGANAFRMFDPNSGREDAPHARLTPFPAGLPESPDLVLVSHDHEDHLDAAALARLAKSARFIAPASQADAIRRRSGAQVLGLSWSGTHRIERDGYSLSIRALPAQHSPRADVATRLGDVNGYWLEFRRRGFRRTVYWTGDGFPVPAEIGRELRRPDLLVPHLGAVGDRGPFGRVSMGAQEAVTFASLVQPRAVLPIHHSTFSLYREPLDRFVRASRGKGWDLVLRPEGGEYVLQ